VDSSATICLVLRFLAPILGLALLVLGAPGRAETPTGKKYAVAAIGDSLTDPRSGGGKYLKTLRKLCPQSRFDAYGIGGQRTDHMRWRIKSDLFGPSTPWMKKPDHYTHVIIFGGINDLSGVSPFDSHYERAVERIEGNLAYMYRVAKAGGVSVIALTISPWGRLRGVRDRRTDATDSLNEWISDQEKHGVVEHAVDLFPLLSCGDPYMLCAKYRRYPDDFIHWNETGHQLVGEAVARGAFSDCR
jgi:GDSL-like Lipase/Acylhydrolase family